MENFSFWKDTQETINSGWLWGEKLRKKIHGARRDSLQLKHSLLWPQWLVQWAWTCDMPCSNQSESLDICWTVLFSISFQWDSLVNICWYLPSSVVFRQLFPSLLASAGTWQCPHLISQDILSCCCESPARLCLSGDPSAPLLVGMEKPIYSLCTRLREWHSLCPYVWAPPLDRDLSLRFAFIPRPLPSCFPNWPEISGSDTSSPTEIGPQEESSMWLLVPASHISSSFCCSHLCLRPPHPS